MACCKGTPSAVAVESLAMSRHSSIETFGADDQVLQRVTRPNAVWAARSSTGQDVVVPVANAMVSDTQKSYKAA